MKTTGTKRTQECHGEGLASTDLPAKKSHWISSQLWLKACPQSVRTFCSKRSHIILRSSTSREGLTESVLSTIVFLKIWIKIRKLNQLAAGRDTEQNQKITITVFLSQADGEPIHSKYSLHKKPGFISGSFRFWRKKPKFVPDLTLRVPPQNIKESTNDFNRRKHTKVFTVLVTLKSETSEVLSTRAHS